MPANRFALSRRHALTAAAGALMAIILGLFRQELKLADILHYVEEHQAMDKAGSYGIQDWIGHIGVVEIRGSYTNVMGLPTQRLYPFLKNLS